MISVVLPVFNEEAVLPLLVDRLRPVLDSLDSPYEVIAVDDGSSDDTRTVLGALAQDWPELRTVALVRNFGHQRALAAGLDAASGDYVVTMDADLQDPPELIPEMLRVARVERVDVVYARRSDRRSDTWFKRNTARIYYRLMRRITNVDLPIDVGDYRVLSARVVLALRSLTERHRVHRLLVPSLGYPSAVVEHLREARAGGKTKYSVAKMTALAADSVTSFSVLPLRIATAVGLLSSVVAMLLAIGAVVARLLGRGVPGWASITVAVLFLGAVQLVCVGLVGEYVGRIYQEVQARPLYLVDVDTGAGSWPGDASLGVSPRADTSSEVTEEGLLE